MSDRVDVAGTATLDGTLEVELVEGFRPGVGQSFTILAAGTRNGMFATESLPTTANRTLDVIYDAQNVVVQVVPLLPGDFNADGTVDVGDYVTWQKSFTATFPNGYLDWKAHFGESLPPGSGSDAAPEPGGWMIICLALAGVTATSPRLRRGFSRRLQ
jgi:hypothetical protein